MEVKVNSSGEIKELVEFLRNEISFYYAYALQRRMRENLNDPNFKNSKYNGKPISNTGRLAMSIKVFEDKNGVFKIVSEAPYSGAIEYGSLPHIVPLSDLMKWLKGKFGVKQKSLEKFAKRVQSVITKKGTKAQPFVEPAIEDEDLLDEAIEKAFNSLKIKYKK